MNLSQNNQIPFILAQVKHTIMASLYINFANCPKTALK